MARSRETIQAEMDAQQALQTELSTLNSPSQTSIYTLWKFITATTISLLEQLWDVFKSEIETTVSKSAVGSGKWFQDRMFRFQYSATTPQIVESINFAPEYPIVNTSLRIITRCSVRTTSIRTVLIKVAKGSPTPSPLSGLELTALNSYTDSISFAGINYVIQSANSDKIYIKADIYYNGQYASVLTGATGTVITAIENYLANIPFDGTVKLLSLVDAIQAVEGVTDVFLHDVAIRSDATLFANKTFLINNNTMLIPVYPTYAGYLVGETTGGETLVDRITFIAQ